ncbi:MAG: chemotaxis protein CheB [Syntrophobacteraceae bacterium]
MAKGEKGKSTTSGDSPTGCNGSRKTIRDTGDAIPIVGIGACASGVSAFEAFFSGMRPETDPGMAFVLVQHLLPDHSNILTDLVRRHTRMQVFEVEDGMEVRPNCAYIIPPGREMALYKGRLQLVEPSAPRGQRHPIDFFFRSLAQDLRERAIGIVLSGSGNDGALGIQAIKSEGGMVMVQDPATADYDAMPRSALATGMVDYLLAPARMPARLLSYVEENFSRSAMPPLVLPVKEERALDKIFVLVRAKTGHDFSQYKPEVVRQSLEQIVALHRLEDMEGYSDYLKQNPSEMEALLHYMLIGATGFFRDPEAFRALQTEVIPRLFAGKPADSVIRVWAPGCATGEEAYSLAILLAERQEALGRSFRLQIHATDIDSRALATARAGIYPAGIASDVSAKRLARYFSPEPDGSAFRIDRSIHDLLVFSEHDVLKAPPLSGLDLICCRNLLMHLNGEMQKKLLVRLHSALNPGGFLFLGASEMVEGPQGLFVPQNPKCRIFQRRQDVAPIRSVKPGTPASLSPSPVAPLQSGRAATAAAGNMSLRQMTEQTLLRLLAPSAVLVRENGDILYIHGRTGLYLEPAPGEAGVSNILEMAREGLHEDLAKALQEAVSENELVRVSDLHVEINGELLTANLSVIPQQADPALNAETPLYLVVFEQSGKMNREADAQDSLESRSNSSRAAIDSRLAAIEHKMRFLEREVCRLDEDQRYTDPRAVLLPAEPGNLVEWLGTTGEMAVRGKAEKLRMRERTHYT